jgi:hypothetical protein
MARRLLYMCLVVVIAALAFAAGALTTGSAGIQNSTWGNDVAAISGVVENGDVLPFPTFSDGMGAIANQCVHLVSVNCVGHLASAAQPLTGVKCETGGPGTTVTIQYEYGSQGWSSSNATANFIVVACRQKPCGPSPTVTTTWSKIKAAFTD